MSDSKTKLIQLVIFNDIAVLSRMLKRVISEIQEETKIPDSGIIRYATVDNLSSGSLWDDQQIVVFIEPDKDTLNELQSYVQEPAWDRIVVIATTKPLAHFRKKIPVEHLSVHESKSKRPADVVAPLLSYLNLDHSAKMAILDMVGESVEEVPSMVDTLLTVYGSDKKLTRDDVLPWVRPGVLPVWALTDAVDRGDITQALGIVNRIWNSSTPVGIIGALKKHIERIYLVHSTGLNSETQVAKLLDMKGSTYPAKKAIQSASQYGHVSEGMLKLILEADIACRGGRGRGVPSRLVVEILVARLCAYPR